MKKLLLPILILLLLTISASAVMTGVVSVPDAGPISIQWGMIVGNLSDQVDLWTALQGMFNLSVTNYNVTVDKLVATNLSGALDCSNITGANYNVCVGDGSGAVDSVTSGDSYIVVSPTTGNVVVSFNASALPEVNLTPYALLNGSNQPFTGDITLSKTAPRIDFNVSNNRIGSFGASDGNNLQFSRNAYFDGSNWQRSDTNAYSLITQLVGTTTVGEYQIYGSAPGSNPINNFGKIFALNIVRRNFNVGIDAGKSLTTGIDNVFFGTKAGEFVTSGNRNLAIGESALSRVTTASNNIALGYLSGQLLNSGTGNSGSADSIFIGRDTRSNTSNQQNEIVIGRNARGAGSNTVVLGASDIIFTQLQGNVSIPSNLNVTGNADVSILYYNALVSKSPHALLEDESGHTRICMKAEDGKVVYQTIKKINQTYKSIITEDILNICDKIVLKDKYITRELMYVNDNVREVETTIKVFENIWDKTKSEEKIIEIRNNIYNYEINKGYIIGDYFLYNNIAYEVIQSHTSQEDWKPNEVPALYKVLVLHEYNEVSAWVQPQGAHDAYPLGAKVTHNNKTWESLYANNVWEPSIFGWKEL